MANRKITAELEISAKDRTGKALSTIEQKLRHTANTANSLTRQMHSANRSFGINAMRQYADVERLSGAVNKVLAVGASAYVAKEMYTNFAEVDRRMTRLAVTAGATDKQAAAALDRVYELSKEYAMAPDKVMGGLETAVASGKTLEESLAFLPSASKAAQATNAEVSEMVDTALKASGALGITADKMDMVFDRLVAQGKAGQFEAKDLAKFVPGLAPTFATLGYRGEDGITRLSAMLQTLRENTADASDAKTQLENILGKIGSSETINKFKKMGVNLPGEKATAAKRGEQPVEAFVEITRKALTNKKTGVVDLSKLSLLFEDTEVRKGMTTLLTKQDSYKRYLDAGNAKDVAGTVDRDVKRIVNDAQAPIDRMVASFNRAITSIGKSVETPVSALLNSVSEASDMESAARVGLDKQGFRGLQKEMALLMAMPFGNLPAADNYERLAREGGYVPAGRSDLKDMQEKVPLGYNILGRYPVRPKGEKKKHDEIGLPISVLRIGKDDGFDRMKADLEAKFAAGGLYRQNADNRARDALSMSFLARNEPRPGRLKAFDQSGTLDDMSRMTTGFEADGKAAGERLKEGAASGAELFELAIQRAADTLTRALTSAAATAAATIAAAKPATAVAAKPAYTPEPVNAEIGRTDGFVRFPHGRR